MHLPGRPMPLLPAALEKEPRRLRERLLSADDGAMAEERWGRKVVVGRRGCGARRRAEARGGGSGQRVGLLKAATREGAAAGKGPMSGGRAEGRCSGQRILAVGRPLLAKSGGSHGSSNAQGGGDELAFPTCDGHKIPLGFWLPIWLPVIGNHNGYCSKAIEELYSFLAGTAIRSPA